MALNLERKKAIVAEVAEIASSALSAVAAEYRGLTVTQMTQLRSEARSKGIYLKVIRNTLARRAVDGTSFACMKDVLKGPLVIAFSRTDPGAAARLVREFSKQNEALVVKALSVSGQLLAANDLDKLANLPTREEALAMLLGVMKAPIEKFVRTLAEPHAKFVRTVAAIRDQKEALA
ncbi:MAG: 50S ribosomal protein L10 [Gammaproteobacteria bacterium]|nr:50S ribosomal protein L10 [Gammaproteobacteria bacterium]